MGGRTRGSPAADSDAHGGAGGPGGATQQRTWLGLLLECCIDINAGWRLLKSAATTCAAALR
eukprot:8727680-Karenia_brevis.AAC.1